MTANVNVCKGHTEPSLCVDVPLIPVTFRLPKPGTSDPYFGASRSFWNERVLPSEANKFKPPVRSVVVRQAGAKRGIRFILFDSARTYFDSLARAQVPEAIAAN